MSDIDHIPGVDYKKQQLATDLCREGAISHEAHNYLVRLAWPRCGCGKVSVGCMSDVFYCWECYKHVFHQRKKARQ